ncbi:MAG: hypothetical protein HKN80_01615 [Acidimicrobiia bacterium]|nr:hypothetical protein [Acidimicrobiia bacterium]
MKPSVSFASGAMRRLSRFLAVVVALAMPAACAGDDGAGGEPTPAQVAARLGQAVEAMERQQLSALVNRDNCRLIEYRGGTFSSHRSEWCIDYASSEPDPFTGTATDDFTSLTAALDVGRATFAALSDVAYSAEGKLNRATFTYFYSFGSELLVFDPGYRLPLDEPGERRHEAVDEDWYLVTVDWN